MYSSKECLVDNSLQDLIDGAVDVLIKDAPFDTEEKRERVVNALDTIKSEVRKATAAMSSVPKPLKFMKERYQEIEQSWESVKESKDLDVVRIRKLLADLLSVLSYTLPCQSVHLSDFTAIPDILDQIKEAAETKKLKDEDEKDDAPGPEDTESILQKFEKLVNQNTEERFREGLAKGRKGVLYRLEGSKDNDLFAYGKEYIRSFTVDVIAEYNMRRELKILEVANVQGHADLETNEAVLECLLRIGKAIVKDLFLANTHVDATDLAAEVHTVGLLPAIIEECVADHSVRLRIAEYLLNLGKYDCDMADTLLSAAISVVKAIERPAEGVRYAATAYSRWSYPKEKLQAYVLDLFQSTYLFSDAKTARAQRLQMLFMIVDCDLVALFDVDTTFVDNIPEEITIPIEETELWRTVTNNLMIKVYYRHLIEELDLQEAKHPSDVYKMYLSQSNTQSLDSTSKNKASTYVNAFVNAGFGNDSLLHEDGTATWLYKNHLSSMTAAAASEGALHLWNVETGYQAMDAYQWSEESYIKAGSNIGFGLVSAGTKGEFNVALDLIGESLNTPDKLLELKCALIGLSLAYNNVHDPSVHERVAPFAFDGLAPDNESACLAALTLAMNCLGSKDENVAESLIQLMITLGMNPSSNLESEHHYKFVALALGLLYIGSGEEEAAGVVDVISNMGTTPFRKGTQILLEGLANVGSGNIDLQARMSRIITDGADVDRDEDSDDEEKDEKDKYATDLDRKLAVIGTALIGMGDEVATAMILKAAESWIHFGDAVVVRTVPLALAILFASNPQNTVIDLLCKLAYDSDQEVALASIMSLAIVSAGTNNAKVAKSLRQMANYYSKSTVVLVAVRWAQGLVHLGKGLLSLSPLQYRGDIIKRTKLAHLMVIIVSCLNMQRHLMEEHNHLLLWHLLAAASPKMLMIIDEETLEPEPISMRVGKAVNTVGVPGNPKSVTSFQTHTSPIVLGHGDQAELDVSAEGVLLDPTVKENRMEEEVRVMLSSTMLEGVVLARKIKSPISQS